MQHSETLYECDIVAFECTVNIKFGEGKHFT